MINSVLDATAERTKMSKEVHHVTFHHTLDFEARNVRHDNGDTKCPGFLRT
jgi:hypothetical protein